jgi:hypothetical protein
MVPKLRKLSISALHTVCKIGSVKEVDVGGIFPHEGANLD